MTRARFTGITLEVIDDSCDDEQLERFDSGAILEEENSVFGTVPSY